MRMLITGGLALLAGPFTLLAQAAAGTDAIPSFATLLVQVGLSGVFLWQWQTERKERAQAQEHLREFLERFAPTLAEAIKVLGEVKQGLMTTVERVQVVPDRNDYDVALRRLELLASDMADKLKERKERGT